MCAEGVREIDECSVFISMHCLDVESVLLDPCNEAKDLALHDRFRPGGDRDSMVVVSLGTVEVKHIAIEAIAYSLVRVIKVDYFKRRRATQQVMVSWLSFSL